MAPLYNYINAFIVDIITVRSATVVSASTVCIIMPRCACASEVYGSVFVYLSVCVDCYSCSGINEVQVRVFIGF